MAEPITELAKRLDPFIKRVSSVVVQQVIVNDVGFLRANGSVSLTGNLSVAAGVTIDGVDISALYSSYASHASSPAVTAHGSVGAHNHQTSANGGLLDHGAALSGLGDDDHTQYAHANGSGTRSAYQSERLNKSVVAGSHLSGGGLLTADRTLEVNLATDFAWSGAHTFGSSVALQGSTTARHILPETTDTYDLGSQTSLWRKGWLSELDTVLFALNTQTLIGGWWVVAKGAGTLAAALAAADTSCDFGQAMTSGDFVVLRSALAVEYLQVGSLVSGTRYNVTRNLDGSGANDWAQGIAYRINGQSGNGRLEFDATGTPRMSILNQGATYNAQTEQGRFGDLNGGWGYTSETYGIALGQYASGVGNLTYDPTNGLRLRTYSTTVMQFSGGNADITGKLRMPDTTSAIAIGNPPPTGSAAGTGIWIDRTGLYSLNSGSYQVKIDVTTGKMVFGGGIGTLGIDGIVITPSTVFEAKRSVSFPNSGYLYGVYDGSLASKIYLSTTGPTGYSGYIGVNAGGGSQAVADITATCAPVVSRIRLTSKSDYSRLIEMDADVISASGNIRYTGNLQSYKNSTAYTGYIEVPLSTPINAASYYTAGFSSASNAWIDVSAQFSGVPDNIKGIKLSVTIRDSGSDGGDYYVGFASSNITDYPCVVRCSGIANDKFVTAERTVYCDSAGNFYLRIVASGAGTMDIYIKALGYLI